ncbi:TauD/TfdA family dioxygenase [Mucilaginibacter sp. RCC_168]|uniref:TauD/TfdA family dioxygenase n=1 Tax=Mucilaginibacter sp. RCC_168 TaxID=3239221 RepID=UPI003525C9E3
MKNLPNMYSNGDVRIHADKFPVVIEFTAPVKIEDFFQWYQGSIEAVNSNLLTRGAVLFRGIKINTASDFEKLTNFINPTPFDYVDGNSPRTKLTSKVYTSTEYDSSLPITLHNELSYASKWPSRLMFCCIVAAQAGGETPIADSREIFLNMDKRLIKEIEEKKIKYIRNLHGGRGLGPSWQSTFETNEMADVERHCRENDISYQWTRGGGIKLIQLRDGIIQHSISGEKVWFNQIDQFHPLHLSAEIYESLLSIYRKEEDLPTYVCFGDDTEITRDMIEEITSTIRTLAVVSPWSEGDLLFLDNVLVCHGRRPYKGNRKILVSMT